MVVLGVRCYQAVNDTETVKGQDSMTYTKKWDTIIANTVNNAHISMMVDGKKISAGQDSLYMDDNRNLLVQTGILRDVFNCAVNIGKKEDVIIEKSNTKIVLGTEKGSSTVNGKNTGDVLTQYNGEYYVPISLFEDYLSYNYKWNYQDNTAELTNSRPDEKIYPVAYDYRDYGRILRVKNQGDLGTCWAFASVMAMETALMPMNEYDFSEDHMTWHNGYNLSQAEGGEYNMSMAYLSSWKGPVYEIDDPYGDGESPDDLTSVVHVQEMQIIASKDLDGIKRAVFLYGGVQSSLYMSLHDSYGNDSVSYNSENSAYCYIGKEKANHDVVIVGWDDSYSADNFSTRPDGDGAFICVNSWGDEFGEDGYFYVSYYDSGIGVHNIVYTKIESTDNYNKVYQSDLCGWIGQLGYNREYAYFANVYKATENELLKAVGFYATGPATKYEIYVVEHFTDESSYKNKRLVATGSVVNAGYYTVDLDEDVFLPAGDEYAVIVYINTPGSKKPVAIEYNGGDATATVDISDGKGYISLHGNTWEHVETTQNCNICLKAYTNRTITSEG